jgi:glycosyltransferase involved in cell wall biosynthesis
MKLMYAARTEMPSRSANSLHIVKMCQSFVDLDNDVCLLLLSAAAEKNDKQTMIFSFYNVRGGFSMLPLSVLKVTNTLTYLWSTFASMLAAFHAIRRQNPELVYGRDLPTCLVAAVAGYPVVYESHFPVWRSKLERVLFFWLIRRRHFLRVVLITEALREAYQLHYGAKLPAQLIKVVPDAAGPVCEKSRVSNWPGREKVLQVGYVGHLYPGKGMEIVAGVAPELPEVDFHVIGGLNDDVEFWQGKLKCDNVFFHGFVEQSVLSSYINCLDVCLLPNQKAVLSYGAQQGNHHDIGKYTSPLKMFDYMAHRKPIVASDLAVLREVLRDDTAILIKHDDIPAWKDAIIKLKSEALREKYSARAFELFAREHTWEIRAKQVLAGLEIV